MTRRTSLTCSIVAALMLCAPVWAPLSAQRRRDPAVSRAPFAKITVRPMAAVPSQILGSRGTVRPSTRRDVLTVVDSDRLEYGSIGAGVGLLGGMVLGSEIANRCKPATSATCTSKGRRLRYILGFGVLGAVVGGATGALIAEQ